MATERIYALFQDVADAERAIGALEDHGVRRENIGVAARRAAEQPEAERVREGYTRLTDREDVREGEPIVSYETRPGVLPPAAEAETVAPTSRVDTPINVETVGKEGLTTTTPQDAAAGAAVGGGVGLVAGLLAAAAALTIPGFGLFLGGGALAAALGATVATTAAGAVAGGAVGYLRDMGMPEQAAQSYADRLREGDYLVTVVADSTQYDELKQLLIKYNAAGVDIDASAAGQQITRVWGNNPAIVEQLRRVPATDTLAPTAPPTAPMLTAAPNTDAVEAARQPFADPMSRTPAIAPATTLPTERIVTEEADGTPLVPAQDVPARDTTNTVPARPVGETPDEEAVRVERVRVYEVETREDVP